MADRPPRPRDGAATGLEERTITTELPGRAGANEERSRQRTLRRLGQPFDRHNPFVVGFVATMGVLLALAFGAAVYSIRATLVLVFLALFIAVGPRARGGLFYPPRVETFVGRADSRAHRHRQRWPVS